MLRRVNVSAIQDRVFGANFFGPEKAQAPKTFFRSTPVVGDSVVGLNHPTILVYVVPAPVAEPRKIKKVFVVKRILTAADRNRQGSQNRYGFHKGTRQPKHRRRLT